MAKILLVEDEPNVAELMAAYMAEHHQVETVNSLAAALPPAKDSDLVLLDLNLPDSCGLGTLNSIRCGTAAPIIVLTGFATGSDAGIAVASGAQDFLLKGTFDQATLMRSVNRALARWPLYDPLGRDHVHPVAIGLSGLHREMRKIRDLIDRALLSHQTESENLAKEPLSNAPATFQSEHRHSARRDGVDYCPPRIGLYTRRNRSSQSLGRTAR